MSLLFVRVVDSGAGAFLVHEIGEDEDQNEENDNDDDQNDEHHVRRLFALFAFLSRCRLLAALNY